MTPDQKNVWDEKLFGLLFKKVSSLDLSYESFSDLFIDQHQTNFFQTSIDVDLAPSHFIKKIKSESYWQDYRTLSSSALCHRDDRKYFHLYRLLEKLRKRPNLIHDPLDEDVQKLQMMRKQVGRDIHKMRAFVRFNEINSANGKVYHAFYEPDHDILNANASFFKERFSVMNWVIITPNALLAWDQQKLHYKTGVFTKSDLPDSNEDAFNNLWKGYYKSIFNPARLKVKAMKNEMPVRFWKNLPEAELISDLVYHSGEQLEQMLKESQRPRVALPIHHQPTLSSLAESIPTCQACPLKDNACAPLSKTQKASFLIVLDQPCDESMNLLRLSLANMGFKSEKLYITHALKHQLTPSLNSHEKRQVVMTCRRWLVEEVNLLRPKVILTLGTHAAHSLTGLPMNLRKERKKVHHTSLCSHVVVGGSLKSNTIDEDLRFVQDVFRGFTSPSLSI